MKNLAIFLSTSCLLGMTFQEELEAATVSEATITKQITIDYPQRANLVVVGTAFGAFSEKYVGVPISPPSTNFRTFKPISGSIIATGVLPNVIYASSLGINGSTIAMIAEASPSSFLGIVDASNAAILGTVNAVTTSGGGMSSQSSNLAMTNSKVFVANSNGESKLYTFDISDKSSPVLGTGSISFTNYIQNPRFVAVSSTYTALSNTDSDQIVIFDNQSSLFDKTIAINSLGGVPLQSIATNGNDWGFVAFQQPTVYLNSFDPDQGTWTQESSVISAKEFFPLVNELTIGPSWGAFGVENELYVFDLTNWTINNNPIVGSGNIGNIAFNGTTGFFINGTSSINIFDPTQTPPAVIGTVFSDGINYMATNLSVSGGTLAAAFYNAAEYDPLKKPYVAFYNLPAQGTAVAIPGSVFLEDYSTSIKLNGTTCLISSLKAADNYYTNVLYVDSVSQSIKGSVSFLALQSTLDAYEDKVVIATDEPANMYYLNPSSPSVLSSVVLAEGPKGVVVNGTYGAILQTQPHITFFNTDNLTITGTLSLDYPSNYIAADGNTACVTTQYNRKASVLDLTKGPSQTIKGYPITILGKNVSVSGNYALVNEVMPEARSGPYFETLDLTTGALVSNYDKNDPDLILAQVAMNGTTGYSIIDVDAPSSGNSIYIYNLFPPATPSPFPENIQGGGNANLEQMEAMLATGNCSPATVEFAKKIANLPNASQKTVAIIDSGSQKKVLQYEIEKLDLLLHKELDHELYSYNDGTHGFLIGGYDNFSQSTVNGYPGYQVDHYYQLLGLTHNFKNVKGLLALGASESYEILKPKIYSSSANYYTVWGTLGVSSRHKRWNYGIDGLFGYSFIDSKRKVQYVDYKSHTSHGMWNVSVDGKLSYLMEKKHLDFMPYDNLGYIYGHENDYTESGAPGNNLHIFNENISCLRNQLGFRFVYKVSRAFNVFVDPAWVYEYYFGNKYYKQQYVGSTIVADVTQTVPTKNYGRINAGFQGTHKRFDYRLAYTGLYGQYLADSAISLKLGYKF